MAGLVCAVPFENITLAASTSKTCVQLTAPTNQMLKVIGYKFGVSGAATTDTQIVVRLVQQTTAGTGGASATPVKRNRALSTTPQATAKTASTVYTVEPTAGDTQDVSVVYPLGTLVDVLLGQPIYVKEGERIGLTANQGSSASTALRAYGELIYEE